MVRMILALALVAASTAPSLSAQSAPGRDDPALPAILSFDHEPKGRYPGGWSGGPEETIVVDGEIKRAGAWAVRIERTPDSARDFSTVTKSLPMDFAGSRIELRGFMRTEDVSEFAGLWMRQDAVAGPVEFDNMQQQQLRGTNDWKEYSISLPVNPAGRMLYFGSLLGGTGKLWVDELELLVDGEPVWRVPKAERALTILDRDHGFDDGSGVTVDRLTAVQIAHLATLGRVWGLLKYHHPQATSGAVHWDYELFRMLPGILAVDDRAAADAALAAWIERLGVPSGDPGPPLAESDLHLRPDLGWLERDGMDEYLRELLHTVLERGPGADGQFYVSFAPNVRNPAFDHEPAYLGIAMPDAGFQLLGLFRFWNIIRYWFPYRDLIEDDWDDVLNEFIPRIAEARDADAYQLELLALIAKVHDTHANLWSSLRVRPPVGDGQLPVSVRFIEDQPVITAILASDEEGGSGLRFGDVIRAIDEVAVSVLVERWSPYYAASNEPTRLRDIARSLTRGPVGPTTVDVERAGETLRVETPREVLATLAQRGVSRWHDLPGPAFRLLSNEVAYLKLSAVEASEAANYVAQAAGTKGWIIDIRNYPSAFMVFALGGHFVTEKTPFARFTVGNPQHPGAFAFIPPVVLEPKSPHYPGKVVILVDESTQSSAEYTTMAFRAAPQAIVVGSTTAAADGNVSRIPLPGGLHTMISGIGVFYPDKRPTQRIGIIPDVTVRPTVAGVRARRDEVLEEGLRQILGPGATDEEIRTLARPSE